MHAILWIATGGAVTIVGASIVLATSPNTTSHRVPKIKSAIPATKLKHKINVESFVFFGIIAAVIGAILFLGVSGARDLNPGRAAVAAAPVKIAIEKYPNPVPFTLRPAYGAANLRAAPTPGADVVGHLIAGQVVSVLGRAPGSDGRPWLVVERDGRRGYIRARLLSGPAGFDCAAATTGVEQAICATPSLAQADMQLLESYRVARRRVGGEELKRLAADQTSWQSLRNACEATDEDCLLTAYRARSEVLKVFKKSHGEASASRSGAEPVVPPTIDERRVGAGSTYPLQADLNRPKSPSPVEPPRLIWEPSSQQRSEYYPRRARGIDSVERVNLNCTITSSGRAQNCYIESETITNLGFGESAMRMSELMKFRPPTMNGDPITQTNVRVPVIFYPVN
jgi:TonB family protein